MCKTKQSFVRHTSGLVSCDKCLPHSPREANTESRHYCETFMHVFQNHHQPPRFVKEDALLYVPHHLRCADCLTLRTQRHYFLTRC